jgi:hypothetical protein
MAAGPVSSGPLAGMARFLSFILPFYDLLLLLV